MIVTAEHTIRLREEIGVTLADGRATSATLAGREPGTDIAVLKLAGAEAPAATPIRELTGVDYGIPTVSYAELAGLLLGWDPYGVVGIQSHTVPVEALLDQIGIPYDRSKEWIAEKSPELVQIA